MNSRRRPAMLCGLAARGPCFLFAWLLGSGGPALASASDAAQGSALQRIEAAEARGEIAFSEAARQKLLYLFARDQVDPRWLAGDEGPAKCGTVLVSELLRARDRLDAPTRALLDRLVRSESVTAPPAETYETTHFRVAYQTSGPDAPVLDDVSPANGIPDFVEETGAALEQAWSVEVDDLGYTAPALENGAHARYPVTYQAQESYGYTVALSGQFTQIVLHPNYAGFPTNDDPDGDVLGALRVTAAHELKHAIQRMYTLWSEGPWLELDATWVEDVVFDSVNDYVHFIRLPGSPLTEPQAPLTAGGGGAYEDCNWQIYQTQRFGNDLMRAFWERRRQVQIEPVMTTYSQTLIGAGTSLPEVWGDYACWNFVSGERAEPGFGYEEAPSYPTAPAAFVHEVLPVATVVWSVAGLAASTQLVRNPDATLGGTPEFTFSGPPAIDWQVSLLVRPRIGTVSRIPVSVVNGLATVRLDPLDWSELEWAAMVIGNPTEAPVAVPYQFSARAIAPVLISHERHWNVAGGPQPLSFVARVTPGTSTLAPGSVALDYRVDGGPIVGLSMAGAGEEYEASIPPQAVGSRVEYRITAQAVDGTVASSPSVLGLFHSFLVEQAFEPFETDGGWTVGDPADDAVSGVWERAEPLGTVAAPYEDVTSSPGSSCYLTERGSPGQSPGAADVDGGRTTLTSPVYSFYAGGPYAQAVARYRRWYSNDIGGRPDDVWRVEASNDGGATWTTVETATQGENLWTPVEVDLLALFGTPSQVRFRFVAEDAGTQSLVEAAVDDFEIQAVLQDPVSVALAGRPAAELGPARPNPGHSPFKVDVALSQPFRVEADVLDIGGRRVKRVWEGRSMPRGAFTLLWDGRTEAGRDAAAGVYVLEVRIGAARLHRRLVKLR